MKFIKDPVEKTTAVTDIILALIALGGIGYLRCLQLNSGQLWKINIWSAAIGLIGLAAVMGAYIFMAIHKDLPGACLMATGVFVSIIAAGIQANKSVFLTFIWRFDHNGIYPLVQIVGLMLLLMGLRWSVRY